MADAPGKARFSLEVVRGKDAGRRYAIAGPSIVLGNAVAAGQGIDLKEQEGDSPRKMAPRQASIEASVNGIVLRDLDSPGGTFVNRQRVLSGQARPLQIGDVIQIGGVQLKVVNGEAVARPPAPAAPPKSAAPAAVSPNRPEPKAAGPFSIPLKSGATARSWDDVLAISAQRWGELRDELTSGRLAGALAAIGRGEFAPDPREAGTPDERLDAWLGRLPTSKPAAPELDVHPIRLELRAKPGGGTLFAKVRVGNTGYRLLRFSVRVEPAGTTWVRPASEFAGGPKAIAEEIEVTLEVTIPETLESPRSGALVVESNGGSRSIPITLEPALSAGSAIPTTSAGPISRPSIGLADWLEARSTQSRIIGGAGLFAAGRLALAMATWGAGLFGIGVSGGSPSVAGSGLALGAIGAAIGWVFATKKKAWADLTYAGIAGAIGGLLLAAVLVAATRSFESIGPAVRDAPIALKVVLWGGLGAAIGATSTIVVPPRRKS